MWHVVETDQFGFVINDVDEYPTKPEAERRARRIETTYRWMGETRLFEALSEEELDY